MNFSEQNRVEICYENEYQRTPILLLRIYSLQYCFPQWSEKYRDDNFGIFNEVPQIETLHAFADTYHI